MKSFLTLLMCLVALLSGAQSFKKQKKQLLAEYNQSVQRYDSLFEAYDHLYAGFPEQRNLFSTSLRDIERNEAQLEEIKVEVLDKLNQLNTLGKLPIGISKTTIDTIPIRISNRIVGSLRQDIARVVQIYHPEFSLNLDGLKRKTQLEYLSSRTADVNDEFRKLELKYQSLHSALLKIKPVKEKLDSARELIDLRKNALQVHLDELNAELEKELRSFRKNGPKGFSEDYFAVFPEVFPGQSFREMAKMALEPDPNVKGVSDKEKVHLYVDEPAEFPGGATALGKFLADNFQYPLTALEQGIDGKCYLQFMIDETGAISNVLVKRGVPDCPECDTEAIRLVEAMPEWIPGKNGGEPVKSLFNLPIIFKID